MESKALLWLHFCSVFFIYFVFVFSVYLHPMFKMSFSLLFLINFPLRMQFDTTYHCTSASAGWKMLRWHHHKGRVKKKTWKSVVFCQTGGGGVSGGGEKTKLLFWNRVFFQRVSRIILGPPKHVLHLVWSAYFISTAVRTAFKVARTPQILGGKKAIIEAIIGAKNNRFWDGTKCKICFTQ